MKYYFQIVCSQYTVGRLRVSWHPTYAEIPYTWTDGEGDVISQIIDFVGDTNFCFSVPYLQPQLYSVCQDTWQKSDLGCNGAIALSVVNAVTSSTNVGDSTVQINLFVAADKDMDFVQLMERPLTSGYTRGVIFTQFAVPSTGWIAQGSDGDMSTCLDDIFKADFPTLIPAKAHSVAFLCEGEKVKDILTIMHRFARFTPTTNTTLSNGVWNLFTADGIASNATNDSAYTMFAAWFLYRRGSYNWKFIRDYQATATPDGVITATLTLYDSVNLAWITPSTLSNPSGKNGTVVEDTRYRPSVEIKQPWVSTFAYVENYNVRQSTFDQTAISIKFNSLGGSSATDSSWIAFMAIGDDFSFGWPCGVPMMAMTQT